MTELNERQTQLSMALAQARRITSDFTNSNSLMESVDVEEVKKHFANVHTRLGDIEKNANDLKKEMTTVLQAMNDFQSLSAQFSQGLSELHSEINVAFQLQSTLQGLKRQQESLQRSEGRCNALGKILETMVASQKKLKNTQVQVWGGETGREREREREIRENCKYIEEVCF